MADFESDSDVSELNINNDANQKRVVIAIDQGTTSSRVVAFDIGSNILNGKTRLMLHHSVPVSCDFPSVGWVEQSAETLFDSVITCMRYVVKDLLALGIQPKQDILCVGITNQRETTIVWDRITGLSLAPAIVWSDSRTANLVAEMTSRAPGKSSKAFQAKTGLPLSSYFSAFKLRWLLDNIPAVKAAAKDIIECTVNGVKKLRPRLAFGTVDTWILSKLTNGQTHITDVTNASRTLLCNIHTLTWDDEMCKFFGIDKRILPEIRSSAELFGTIALEESYLLGIPITGILGDQQASLVGQTWPIGKAQSMEKKVNVKITYGTGAFLLCNVGVRPTYSSSGLLTTVAYKMGPNGETHYALEGAAAFAGATITWLKKKMKMFTDFEELEKLAEHAHNSAGLRSLDPCYLVPAFSGLFCPYWCEDARACITGISAGVTKEDVLLAGLRSSAYQTYDLLQAITGPTAFLTQKTSLLSWLPDSSATYIIPLMRLIGYFCLENPSQTTPDISTISVDGGKVKSNLFLRCLADITGSNVNRHSHSDFITAIGAGVAAALGMRMDPTLIASLRVEPNTYKQGSKEITEMASFEPSIAAIQREGLIKGWKTSVESSMLWSRDKKPDWQMPNKMSLLMGTCAVIFVSILAKYFYGKLIGTP